MHDAPTEPDPANCELGASAQSSATATGNCQLNTGNSAEDGPANCQLTTANSQASPDGESWDLILTPKVAWFDFRFGDLWRYRDLIALFVKRDFVAVYKQTILGPLWFLSQPLLTTLIFTVIFSRVAKIPTDGVPPMLFYLSGVTAWAYFSGCLNKTSNTFVGNAAISAIGRRSFLSYIQTLSSVTIIPSIRFSVH